MIEPCYPPPHTHSIYGIGVYFRVPGPQGIFAYRRNGYE
jgi:hypothetical protein